MTLQEANDALGSMFKLVVRTVRDVSAPDGPNDPVDRALAAAALLAGAAVLIWPQGRKAPQVAGAVATVAQQVWRRRAWWLPTA